MKTAPTIWNSNRAIYGDPAVMTADWAFVKRLKELDPALDVVWNRIIERWIIIERGHQSGRWHVVARVENPDGTYRGLDNRIIWSMRETKWRFDKGSQAFCKYLQEREDAEKVQQWKDYENKIHSIGDWYALQMMGIPQVQVPHDYQGLQGKESPPIARDKAESATKSSD